MAYYVGMSAIIRKAPHVAGENAAAERKQNMRYRRYSASSLTDSLRSVVRLRRAVPAYGRDGNFLVVDAREKLNREAIRSRRSRFSIGSAP
jgi:hypothetical protein